MVNHDNPNKMKLFLKKTAFLAIALVAIANLIFGNTVFAKKIEITDKDVKRIKTGLGLIGIFENIVISDDKLKTILNMTISTAGTGTDITYGLLALSTFSEIDFIDTVVSQKYKQKSDEYFNKVLDERLNLGKYYQGLGFDVLKVIRGNITGPIAALTLNTFEITNKTIQIGVEIQNLKMIKLYDGLWHYFDTRGPGGESHQTAWEEAKIVMGWAIKPTFLIDPEIEKYNESQLESQFSTLYEKWGPYVTINVGINEEYKKQAQKELGESIVYAIKTHEGEFVQKEAKPSILDKAKLAYEDLKAKINNLVTLGGKATQTVQKIIKEGLGQITSKIQELKKFGGARLTPPTEEKPIEKVGQEVGQKELKKEEGVPEEKEKKEMVEVKPQQPQQPQEKKQLTLKELQEMLDDIVERIDVMSVKAAKLTGKEKLRMRKN